MAKASRIAESFRLLATAGKTLVFGPESQPATPREELEQAVARAGAMLETMRTPGWRIYEAEVLKLRTSRVEELLAFGPDKDNSARCLHTGFTKGLSDAIEAGYALVTAGEIAERELADLGAGPKSPAAAATRV